MSYQVSCRTRPTCTASLLQKWFPGDPRGWRALVFCSMQKIRNSILGHLVSKSWILLFASASRVHLYNLCLVANLMVLLHCMLSRMAIGAVAVLMHMSAMRLPCLKRVTRRYFKVFTSSSCTPCRSLRCCCVGVNHDLAYNSTYLHFTCMSACW